MKFNTLEINESILKAVTEMGYENPTPIQEQAIPHALRGEDILGCAQTGTGKTAAFLIPTIQRLKKHNPSHIRSLVLTPTRELAIQIQENLLIYAKYTNIKSAVIFGGVSQRSQEVALQHGVDILIATPGRLLDLIRQKIINIGNIEVFILDEADRMLDMGFLFDMKKVIALLPKQKQTLFFSATMPKEIKSLAESLLHEPKIIEVTPPSTTVEYIQQSLYYIDKANKKRLLLDMIKHEKMESVLVFTRTKSGANRLGKFLEAAHIKVGVIHGNKSQNARQIALSKFKSGEYRVLVATDIAARGIDINELKTVFNYDIPNEAEAYVHRIGRTGRAGNEGISISFADIDEVELVKNIQKLIRLNISVVHDHAYPMMITVPSPKKGQRNASAKPKRTNTKPQKAVKEKQPTTEKISTDKQDKKFSNRKKKDKDRKFQAHNGDHKSTKKPTKRYGKDHKGNSQKPKSNSRYKGEGKR